MSKNGEMTEDFSWLLFEQQMMFYKVSDFPGYETIWFHPEGIEYML